LTKGYVTIIDEENYDLVMSVAKSWQADIHVHGVYARATHIVDGKKRAVRMHRVIMGLGRGPSHVLKTNPERPFDFWQVNHINFNTLDNRLENLELVNPKQQAEYHQKMKQRNGQEMTSKYKGVWLRGNKWEAGIRHNGVNYYLGRYDDEIDAARAYNQAAAESFTAPFLNDLTLIECQ
jgi:hypothetical protein